MTLQLENKRVMLIDDDVVTNLINTKVFKKLPGLEVSDYVNGQLAIEQLKQWCQSTHEKLPSVILLDINMPIMDGWEFLDEFQKLPGVAHQKSKIYILTSSIDFDDIERAKSYPLVCDFISKPLTPDRLRSLIQI